MIKIEIVKGDKKLNFKDTQNWNYPSDIYKLVETVIREFNHLEDTQNRMENISTSFSNGYIDNY